MHILNNDVCSLFSAFCTKGENWALSPDLIVGLDTRSAATALKTGTATPAPPYPGPISVFQEVSIPAKLP